MSKPFFRTSPPPISRCTSKLLQLAKQFLLSYTHPVVLFTLLSLSSVRADERGSDIIIVMRMRVPYPAGMSAALELEKFCREMPKIELHAHLNGSISNSTMQKLLQYHRDRNTEGGACRETQPHIWETTILKGEKRSLADCFLMFKMIHTLVNDEESVRMVAHDVVIEFAEDGVVYLELRSTPRANPATGMTKSSYVESVLCGIDRALSECITTIHVRLLLSIDRRQSVSEAMETVELAVAYSKQTYHQARVVGIDLSGDPTVGDISSLVPILHLAKEKGLKLAVHIAEVSNRNDETASLLSVQPDRLGHGTFIHQEAGGSLDVENIVLANKIPIEMCLTSNVKGLTVSNLESHHFRVWYKRGHPVIICTDDKGIFSTTLSEEYTIAGQTFSLCKQELLELARCAVNFIFETDSFKEKLKKLF